MSLKARSRVIPESEEVSLLASIGPGGNLITVCTGEASEMIHDIGLRLR